jgi:hypothetical protein
MKNTSLMMCFIAALAIFASPVVLGQGISGRWYHDGKATSISVSGFNVTITNEHGQSSSGHVTGSDLIMPFLGIRGHVSHSGRSISWTNGTEWTREPPKSGSALGQGLGGRWYHDGKPTSINVSSGGSVTITNEVGQSGTGHMSGNEIVISGGLRGQVSHGGQRISWNNGTEWRR